MLLTVDLWVECGLPATSEHPGAAMRVAKSQLQQADEPGDRHDIRLRVVLASPPPTANRKSLVNDANRTPRLPSRTVTFAAHSQ